MKFGWRIFAAITFLLGNCVRVLADDVHAVAAAWQERGRRHLQGDSRWRIQTQARSETFRGMGGESHGLQSFVQLAWDQKGFLVRGICPPPNDISVLRNLQRPDFLGFQQIRYQYLDSLASRFRFHRSSFRYRSYLAIIRKEQETHLWPEEAGAFPLAAVCPTWQGDEHFHIPTVAWVADATRVALGITNLASSEFKIANSGDVVQLANLSCQIWSSRDGAEQRVYWIEPAAPHRVRKCIVQFPDGRARRRYDFTYSGPAEDWQLETIRIQQLSVNGLLHDQIVLQHQSPIATGIVAFGVPPIPAGTLLSDFHRRGQFLILPDARERLVTLQDLVVHKTYDDLVRGSTPSSVLSNWAMGFRPSREELMQAVRTWDFFAVLAFFLVLFCLIPVPRRKRPVVPTDKMQPDDRSRGDEFATGEPAA